MYEKLKERVLEANLSLKKNALVISTWGNISEIDRNLGVVAIKPSGVRYEKMNVEDIVITDLDGNILDGKLRPSVDLMTHLELYKNNPLIISVAHTHSTYATAWAQAGLSIPALGTTHADTFFGEVTCTRSLTKEEVESDYERNTGKLICESLNPNTILNVPAILVKNHGPFVWGKSAIEAMENCLILEEIAKMAILTLNINPGIKLEQYLLDKHFNRKHGKTAVYGQK